MHSEMSQILLGTESDHVVLARLHLEQSVYPLGYGWTGWTYNDRLTNSSDATMLNGLAYGDYSYHPCRRDYYG